MTVITDAAFKFCRLSLKSRYQHSLQAFTCLSVVADKALHVFTSLDDRGILEHHHGELWLFLWFFHLYIVNTFIKNLFFLLVLNSSLVFQQNESCLIFEYMEARESFEMVLWTTWVWKDWTGFCSESWKPAPLRACLLLKFKVWPSNTPPFGASWVAFCLVEKRIDYDYLKELDSSSRLFKCHNPKLLQCMEFYMGILHTSALFCNCILEKKKKSNTNRCISVSFF